jgi:non-heme chloroperoxidase
MREHVVTGGGGVRLRLREAGDPQGPSLLFLHGWSQCGLCWAPQFESDLARDFRLVAMDLRGHGRSDKPADAYGDSALWAADLHAVITELALERPVVTGWSYGGLVICDYLRGNGDAALGGVHLVGAITELGTTTAAASVGPEFLAAARDSYSDDVVECIAGVENYLRVVVGPELPDQDMALLVGYNALVPPQVRKQLFKRRVNNDDVLRALTVPVLVTHGADDQVVLASAGERHAGLISHARHSVYPDAGHAPFVQASTRFNQELRDFATLCQRPAPSRA